MAPIDDGFNRAEVLAARLALLAPDLQVDTYPVAVEEANTVAITTGHDAVVDASGDPSAGRLLSRASAELGIPIVHFAHGGILTTRPRVTACLACAKAAADAFPKGNISVPVGNAPVVAGLPGAERSLQAGLMGAVAATDLAAALREPRPRGRPAHRARSAGDRLAQHRA